MAKIPLRNREGANDLVVVGVTRDGYLILQPNKKEAPEWLNKGRFLNKSSVGNMRPGWIDGYIYPDQKPLK